MTWHPSHPGGMVTCDADGCTRTRRMYCTPTERDGWKAELIRTTVRDRCPNHSSPEGEAR